MISCTRSSTTAASRSSFVGKRRKIVADADAGALRHLRRRRPRCRARRRPRARPRARGRGCARRRRAAVVMQRPAIASSSRLAGSPRRRACGCSSRSTTIAGRHQRAPIEEREVVAADERRVVRRAPPCLRLVRDRGERREHREAERAADLLRGVEEPGREPGVLVRRRSSSRAASPARTSGPCRST